VGNPSDFGDLFYRPLAVVESSTISMLLREQRQLLPQRGTGTILLHCDDGIVELIADCVRLSSKTALNRPMANSKHRERLHYWDPPELFFILDKPDWTSPIEAKHRTAMSVEHPHGKPVVTCSPSDQRVTSRSLRSHATATSLHWSDGIRERFER
jgi:hypothetical protein